MEWILGAIFLIAIIVFLARRPLTLEERAQRAYESWLSGCIRRGMTSQQIRDEAMFRRAFASLRRRASDSAVANPGGAYEEARRIAIEEGENLAILDKTVARRFLRAVSESQWSEIFYPEALKAIDLWWKKNPPMTARTKADLEKDISAFTTIK